MGYKLLYHILVLPSQVLLINSVLTNEVLQYILIGIDIISGDTLHILLYSQSIGVIKILPATLLHKIMCTADSSITAT